MSEVAKAARDAIARHNKGVDMIRFSACLVPDKSRRSKSGYVTGYRWVTTSAHEIVVFFRVCWNNRHELAKLDQDGPDREQTQGEAG